MKVYLRALFVCLTVAMISGCSCTYNVVNKSTKAIEQTVKADAPGGEAVVVMVYFSDQNVQPILKAGVDSSDLVNATAAIGRQAVSMALKANGIP
jgi:hypothetical protein